MASLIKPGSLVPSPPTPADFANIAYATFKDGFNRVAVARNFPHALMAMGANLVPIFGYGYTAFQVLQFVGVVKRGNSAVPFQTAMLAANDIPPETVIDISIYAREKYGDEIWTRVTAGLMLADSPSQFQRFPKTRRTCRRGFAARFTRAEPVCKDIVVSETILQTAFREGKVIGATVAARRALKAGIIVGRDQVAASSAWLKRFHAREREVLRDAELRASITADIESEFPQQPEGHAGPIEEAAGENERAPRSEPEAEARRRELTGGALGASVLLLLGLK